MFYLSHHFCWQNPFEVHLSLSMANEAHSTVTPLETGRQLFSWFCVDAIDEPLSKYQLLARKVFKVFYGVLCAVLIVIFNASLFQNFTLMMNNTNELFYGFFQLNSTLEALACVFAMYISGRQLASLFRNLGNIYNACKNLLLWLHFYKNIKRKHFNRFLLIGRIPDPDERLAKTNKKCEHFYRILIKFLTNWQVKVFVSMSVASIVICQLKYGLGAIYTESLYHPMRTVWV